MMDSVFKKNGEIVFRKIGDEYILVPLAHSVADISSIFNLNETGAAIWNKIDGRKKLRDIVEEMKIEYEEAEQIEADVLSFIADISAAKLVVV